MNRCKAWLRRWLGVEEDSRTAAALIQGLRGDLEGAAQRINTNTQAVARVIGSHEVRLRTYEHGIPAMARLKRALDEKQEREARRAEFAIVPNADAPPIESVEDVAGA